MPEFPNSCWKIREEEPPSRVTPSPEARGCLCEDFSHSWLSHDVMTLHDVGHFQESWSDILDQRRSGFHQFLEAQRLDLKINQVFKFAFCLTETISVTPAKISTDVTNRNIIHNRPGKTAWCSQAPLQWRARHPEHVQLVLRKER